MKILNKIFQLLLIGLALTLVLFGTSMTSSLKTSSCSSLRDFLQFRGINRSLAPLKAFRASKERFCSLGRDKAHAKTCCTLTVEEKLKKLSLEDFLKVLTKNIRSTKNLLGRKAMNNLLEQINIFTAYFQNITRAKMLDSNTRKDNYRYSDLYSKRFQIPRVGSQTRGHFEFLDPLWNYLSGVKVNLVEETRKYFFYLLSGTFMLLSSNLNDYAIRDCVRNKVFRQGLDVPFGDLPRNYIQSVGRALHAARVIEQGMSTGHKALVSLLQVMNDTGRRCQFNLTKTKYCSLCSTDRDFKPCKENCIHAINRCFGDIFSFIAPVWKDYVTALVTLVEGLEGCNGFEAVVNNVDIVISEALKTLEDKYQTTLKNQIQQICNPPPERGKQSMTSQDNFYSDNERVRRKTKRHVGSDSTELGRLFAFFKVQVNSSKDVWNGMSDSACSWLSGSNGECWNGTHVVMPSNVSSKCMKNAKDSRSFIGNHSKIPKVVKELSMKLKRVTVSMRLASVSGDVDEDDRAAEKGYSVSRSRDDIPTEESFKKTLNMCSIAVVESTTGDTKATTGDITLLEATHSDIRATTSDITTIEVGLVEATATISSKISSNYKVNQKHSSSVSSRACYNLAFSLHYSGHVMLLMLALLFSLQQMSVVFAA